MIGRPVQYPYCFKWYGEHTKDCKRNEVSSAPVACSKGDVGVGEGGLLPCPFCGCTDIDVTEVHGVVMMEEPEYYEPYCKSCGANIAQCSSQEEARDCWNFRNGKSL